jgi:signal transduction histidine kinase
MRNPGLGFSICRHIVESHEGVILCENRGNTRMSVRLPIYNSTIPASK